MIDPSAPFTIRTKLDFDSTALAVFRHQTQHCPVYRDFVKYLGVDPALIKNVVQIPFLPVELFKTHQVITGDAPSEMTFTSSGTTGTVQSRHYVTDLSIYKESYRCGFRKFYGDIGDYTVLALLPSYQEREGSSLIYMVDDLIRLSNNDVSGYCLHEDKALYHLLTELAAADKPTILIGVTYALLDFAEKFTINFPSLIVMETGGMKGRRREMVRDELHQILCKSFGVPVIHSEYGMTELLSQAYSKGNGIFRSPPWMSLIIRDTNDPLTVCDHEQTGGVNIIDLANLNSCSFIATQDLGRIYADGSFEILGRFDNSDIRGCNLLL